MRLQRKEKEITVPGKIGYQLNKKPETLLQFNFSRVTYLVQVDIQGKNFWADSIIYFTLGPEEGYNFLVIMPSIKNPQTTLIIPSLRNVFLCEGFWFIRPDEIDTNSKKLIKKWWKKSIIRPRKQEIIGWLAYYDKEFNYEEWKNL
jgi:hypothetical protein